MIKSALASLLVSVFAVSQAANVGIFDDTRLYSSIYNLETGAAMTELRSIYQARGAVFHQTDSLTAEFLSGVSALHIASISAQNLSASEKANLVSWVQSGGTLLIFGECGCYGTQAAYNSFLNEFGVTLSGTTSYGPGTVVASHPITQGLASVYIGKNGTLAGPSSAKSLINDQYNYVAALVMEYTQQTGSGRVFVMGDGDMFTDVYMQAYPNNKVLAENFASWALNAMPVLSGTISLPGYLGEVAGLPLSVQLFDGVNLVGSYSTTLGPGGAYSVTVSEPGTCDVVVKPYRWLSRRQTNVLIAGNTVLDWTMAYNGDVNGDNIVDLMDLNGVLLQFAQTGPLTGDLDGDSQVGLNDLNIVLINFTKTGE